MLVVFPNKEVYQHQSGATLCSFWTKGYRQIDMKKIIFVSTVVLRKSLDTIPVAGTHQLHTTD